LTNPQGIITNAAIWAKRIRNNRLRLVGAILLTIVLPDWISRGNFWYHLAQRLWPVMKSVYNSEWDRLSIVIVGVLLLLVPWQRLRWKTQYDVTTLKGRTLELRDDMQAFLDNAHPNEQIGNTKRQNDVLESSGAALRVDQLHHGYEARFANRLNLIFNEFGECGLRDLVLADGLAGPLYKEDWYRIVIVRLSKLAERPQAAS